VDGLWVTGLSQMQIETICEILVVISMACSATAIWLHHRKMNRWFDEQEKSLKELEDNWSQHVQ
jgi:hypothetical protein